MRTSAFQTPRRARLLMPALVFAVSVLFLVGAPAAHAAITITSSSSGPVVGESVTFEAEQRPAECAEVYTYTVDGVDQPPSSERSLTTSFASPGEHTVSVTVTESAPCNGNPDSGTLTLTVHPDLAGTIAVSPDPPRANQPATLTAGQTGGYGPPYTYAWDTDDDGIFDDGTDRVITTVFPATGPHTVRVQISDSADPVHTATVERTLNVVDPPPPGVDPPPPTPPPCVKRLAFALSEFTTGGCFTRTSAPSEQWETTTAVKLNGISFPDYGQRFVITLPTPAEPGGHFTAPGSAVQVGDLTVFAGDIDWALPAGDRGDEKTLRTLAVPQFAKLFQLPVLGSTAVRLGWGPDGRRYAILPLNIQFPNVFKPAPNTPGVVTGAASVRVDDRGPNYDGLKISASDAWIGRIKVPEACFSYVPAGGSAVSPCDPPTLDGEPYLTCNNEGGTDRWDGNAILELPVDNLQYAAFGGFADGRLAKLGGFADNIGAVGLQLAPGVEVERLGAGVCLDPPPLKVRGDVGVGLLKGKLRVNGRFIYTDPFNTDPWSIEVGGNAAIGDLPLGDGSMRFNAWGQVDFGLNTELNLFDVASLEGQANGWVEPQSNLFNVSGTLNGCLATLICADTAALVSSSGVAGCIDAGELILYEPVNPRTGPFGFGSISFSLRKRVVPLRAGFGHRFGSASVDLLGNSCDFSPYSATRSASTPLAGAAGPNARAADARISERISAGAKAVSLRIHGSDGPPKVIVRGPDGTTITSPENRPSRQDVGRYLLAENATDGTTSVLVVKPAAGAWTIEAAPGATSTPTSVDRADFEPEATLFGQLRRTAKGREIALAYAVPKGAKVRLVERSRKGIGQTIERSVSGRPCRGARTLPGGRTLLCARVRFRPSRGPGGKRNVEAIVTRKRIPLARKNVASFRVPGENLPSQLGPLRARRKAGGLVIAFPRSQGASRYAATAVLSDGRRLGFDLGRGCRALRIPEVPAGVRALVKVAGVRYDSTPGRYRRIELRPDRKAAGPPKRLPKRICR